MAGESMHSHAGDHNTIATELFRRCVTRPPTGEELDSIVAYFKQQMQRIKDGEASATDILRTGPTTEWTFSFDSAGWKARNQCEIEVIDKLLIVKSSGEDPFIGTDISSTSGLHSVRLRAVFDSPGNAEVYWTSSKQPEESAERQVAIAIVPNEWRDYSAVFQVEGNLRSLRIRPRPTRWGHQVRTN